MTPHSYLNASDNIAQYHADQIGRQEVTVDWYLDHMIDAPLFRWTNDDDVDMGLDPWRYYADLPIEPEDAIARGWRIFVQRKDMPEGMRTEAHKPFPPLEWPADDAGVAVANPEKGTIRWIEGTGYGARGE